MIAVPSATSGFGRYAVKVAHRSVFPEKTVRHGVPWQVACPDNVPTCIQRARKTRAPSQGTELEGRRRRSALPEERALWTVEERLATPHNLTGCVDSCRVAPLASQRGDNNG